MSRDYADAPEYALWRRIADNGHKVPGLELKVQGYVGMSVWNPGVYFKKSGWSWSSMGFEAPGAEHRAVAMLIVDAIEAAGLAWFMRIWDHNRKRISWEAHDLLHDFFADGCDKDDHIALLTCLAETLEVLPKAEA